MSVKYAPLAEEIVELVGGPENVAKAYHCQTRLRFSLRDESKAEATKIAELDGVVQTLSAGGVFQVVIGTHVKDVFEEIDKLITAAGVDLSDASSVPEQKMNPVMKVIDFISSTFTPVIPAIAGAGMVSAVLSLLVFFKWVSPEDQTYAVIAFAANTCFYFLPIFLGFSAARKLGTNPYLAAVVAAMMLHPTWAGMVAAGEPVKLFDLIPLTLTSYASSVIPILLIIFVQSYVEKFLNRVIPRSIEIVVVPLLVFLIMAVLAFSVLGPIGAIVGGYLADFFLWLSVHLPWAAPTLIGALLPVMVMFGIHTAVGPIGLLQLGQLGYDTIFGPGALCSNIAQAAAASVAAFRAKDGKFRQVATAAAITAFMGVTEPALYGVNLPKRYPLIAAMIGGGAGGFFAGITGTRRFATGSSGLPAIPMYIGDGTLQYFYQIIGALLISVAVTVVVAIVLSVRFERKEAEKAAKIAAPSLVQTISTPATTGATSVAAIVAVDELTAPCQGTVVPLKDIADAAFASGALGPGLGIEPQDGRIVAPCPGTVVAAMDSGHAYGIRTDDGVEVLIHVGIDTVQMNGEGFAPAVKKGDRVAAGATLANVDLAAIAAAGYPSTVIFVVTNAKKLAGVEPIAEGSVVAGEPVIRIKH